MAHTEKNSNYNIFSWNSYAWPEQLNCLENWKFKCHHLEGRSEAVNSFRMSLLFGRFIIIHYSWIKCLCREDFASRRWILLSRGPPSALMNYLRRWINTLNASGRNLLPSNAFSPCYASSWNIVPSLNKIPAPTKSIYYKPTLTTQFFCLKF